MKKLNEFINEALNNMPKEFLNIWKGKSANIDIEYMENPALLAQSIMDVHRRNLPTEEEFMNLCEWIIKNVSSPKVVERILDVMYEVFGVSYGIKQNDVYDWDLKKWFDGHSTDENDFTYKLFFLIQLFIKENETHDFLVKKFKNVLRKWNIGITEWPDYSAGIQLLAKKFYKG